MHALFLLILNWCITWAPELWEVIILGSRTPTTRWATFLPPRHPSRLPTALIVRPSAGVTELEEETRKLLQQSSTNVCTFGKCKGELWGHALGLVGKGKASSHDFDGEFQEPRGALRSPEPLLSVKQLRIPFLLPLHKNRGCQHPSSECYSR